MSGTGNLPVRDDKYDGNRQEDVPRVRNLLLRCMCGVYLLAFVSFYCHADGLYSDNGINPASGVLINGTLQERLTLLQLSPLIGLDAQNAIDLLCLVGSVIAFLGVLSSNHCRLGSFIGMWTLYFSLVQICQVFRQQVDYLLLEAGFLCVLLSPSKLSDPRSPIEDVALLLLKWLVFRFIFASGSVKLASGCPIWWELDGLKRHYETMPLPTSYSWYTYQLPEVFHRLSTIYVYVSELLVPWLFFAPNQKLRMFAGWWQVFLHLNIIGCGNYGFLSPIVLTLLLTLLDDKALDAQNRLRTDDDKFGSLMVKVFCIFTILGSCMFFGIDYRNGEVTFNPIFNKAQYLEMMKTMIKIGPLLVLGLMVSKVLKIIISQSSVGSMADALRKFTKNVGLLLLTIVAFTVFFMSIVPHSRLLPSTSVTSRVMTRAYSGLHNLFVVNQYGRHLTKMRPARREIILEYSDDINGTWHEYGFQYKPCKPNGSMPYAGLYFPRFDFKFYDASGTKANAQKWFYPMIQRLLQNDRNVLALFDPNNVPTNAPKYIRASLYKFSYTNWSEQSSFWNRDRITDYFTVYSLDNEVLRQKLRELGMPVEVIQSKSSWNFPLRWLLAVIRRFLSAVDGSHLITGILVAILALLLAQTTA